MQSIAGWMVPVQYVLHCRKGIDPPECVSINCVNRPGLKNCSILTQAGLCSFKCLLSLLKASKRFNMALRICIGHKINSIDGISQSEAHMVLDGRCD